jgi:hypothetical protein
VVLCNYGKGMVKVGLIQCCGAGYARSHIIMVEPEPEPQRDAASAPMTSALNLVFNCNSFSLFTK